MLCCFILAHGGLRCRWDHLIPSWGWQKPSNVTQTPRKWTWVWGHTGTTMASHMFSTVSARYGPFSVYWVCGGEFKPGVIFDSELNSLLKFQVACCQWLTNSFQGCRCFCLRVSVLQQYWQNVGGGVFLQSHPELSDLRGCLWLSSLLQLHSWPLAM